MISWTSPTALVIELLLHFIGVEVLEQVALLPLIITDIERVSCNVVLLTVKIFTGWQRVVIRTCLHGSLIARRSIAKATLMWYLSW